MAQLFNNNMVFIELDSLIAATDGTTLESDYTWYFTTTYDPLYTSVRRIRVDMGNLVSDIPDDTINLIIFESSLEAKALTFTSALNFTTSKEVEFFNFARKQYTTCAAELMLLDAIEGSSGSGKTKQLGDLQVSYSNSSYDKTSLLNRLLNCKTKWESILTSAGVLGPGTSQKPSIVQRGYRDPDRPTFGRDWENTVWYNGYDEQIPAANSRTLAADNGKTRWKRNFRSVRWNSRYQSD